MGKEEPKVPLEQAAEPSPTERAQRELADQMMREVSGFYDHAKVEAFMCCVVDLAEANDMTLLECFNAFKSLLLATEAKIAEKSGALDVPGADDEVAESAEPTTRLRANLLELAAKSPHLSPL